MVVPLTANPYTQESLSLFLFLLLAPTMAHSQSTQGPSLVGFGAPLKEIANLYGTIPSAPTPSTKDLGHKETISPIVAQLAQVLAEHLKGTMAAQTPGNISNTVPETPDSAIVSPGPTSQTHESSLSHTASALGRL